MMQLCKCKQMLELPFYQILIRGAEGRKKVFQSHYYSRGLRSWIREVQYILLYQKMLMIRGVTAVVVMCLIRKKRTARNGFVLFTREE